MNAGPELGPEVIIRMMWISRVGYIGIDYLIVATCRQVIGDWEMGWCGTAREGKVNSD